MRCIAFCSTKSYRLAAIANFFRTQNYNVKLYRKVLHISNTTKDIFVFSYGCFITWGLDHTKEKQLLEQLKPFAIDLLPVIETGRFIYKYGDHTTMATHERFNVDIITLESQSTRLKLAISYGLAQSVQLESHESAVQQTIEQNSHYPEQIAKKGRISLSQKAILQQMGQILLARTSINLNSEYLAAPEHFWEYPSLENFYNMSEKFLDIPRRVATLNQKLNVLHELFVMLSSQLQYRHSNILEMIIILLIFVEIILTLLHKFIY